MSYRHNAGDGHVAHYQLHGYAVVKGVFGPDEVHEMAHAFDRIAAQALSHRASFRDGNVLFRTVDDPALGRIVRYVQWPSYFDEVMARYRTDPRLAAILEPLIGTDVKQIINQLHWKPPGAEKVEFGYHQDIHFRRPPEAYRDPGPSYVQTAIAIDPHRADNGAVVVYPESHMLGALSFPDRGRIMDSDLSEADLVHLGLDPSKLVALVLDPGDVALWGLFTVHGSGVNRAGHDRRVYINGYVTAADCDLGTWAFRDGRPCPLDL